MRTLPAGHDSEVFEGTRTRGQYTLTVIPKHTLKFYRSKVDSAWKVIGEFRGPLNRTNIDQTEVPT